MADLEPPATEGPESGRAKELLGEATLLRLRGNLEPALAKCQEAITLEASDAEAHELLGDLLLQLERPTPALEAYRQAKGLNPQRAKLEEKIGVAALGQARQVLQRQRALDLAEGRYPKEPERKPALAALLSFVVPGFGQIYNRDLFKGLVLLCLALLLLAGMLLSVLSQLPSLQQPGAMLDAAAVFSLFFQGGTLWLTLIYTVIWIIAIADAILQASKSMTSDDSGMI